MQKNKLKIMILCANSLISEAFKSIIIASGYKSSSVNDYIDLKDNIKNLETDLLLIDENITANGKTKNYYDLFKGYKENLPVLVAVKEDNKKFLKKDIFTYIKKPINITEFKKLVEPYRKNSKKLILNKIKLGKHEYKSYSKTLELIDGSKIRFTSSEAALIMIFIKNVNKSLSSKFLIEKILGYSSQANSNTLKTHIWRLRKKLGNQNINFELLNNNDGYVLKKK
tara:strand:+ start:1103 stop:1780 length:678 start_codon:yes stop_codon:yes gene_type:complete